MSELYPLNMDIRGKKVLVVGGGGTGTRKVLSLLACGADVTVVSTSFTKEIEAEAAKGGVILRKGYFQEEMCCGSFLIFACTSDKVINHRIVVEARRLKIPVNCVDDPASCDFTVPASFSRGDLLISISTGASSPALAAAVKRKLENIFGDQWIEGLALLQDARKRAKEEIADSEKRRTALKAIGSEEMLELIEAGDIQGIKNKIETLLDG